MRWQSTVAESKRKLAKIPGQFSEKFVELMRRQALHAFYKYGATVKNAKSCNFSAEASHRLALYQKTGNTEYLVDVATFSMCEFMYPKVDGAGYSPCAKSTELVASVSSKEIEELNKENGL